MGDANHRRQREWLVLTLQQNNKNLTVEEKTVLYTSSIWEQKKNVRRGLVYPFSHSFSKYFLAPTCGICSAESWKHDDK